MFHLPLQEKLCMTLVRALNPIGIKNIKITVDMTQSSMFFGIFLIIDQKCL